VVIGSTTLPLADHFAMMLAVLYGDIWRLLLNLSAGNFMEIAKSGVLVDLACVLPV
jgi:hypothetical protein